MFHRGPHQHHRGDGQDQQIGDRIGERDGEVQAIRLRLVVEPFQDGDPADQEQRAGHDETVDQHPPAGAGIAFGRVQQQPHAGTDRKKQEHGVGRGDVYDGPVNVAAWDASMKEKVPSVITVDDYFSKNMKLGSQPITIVGQVATKRVDHNEVWIILGASGGKVHGELSRFKINDTVKQQYESIQIGSRVAFKGSFNMEMGNTAYFTIEEIVLNPSY